MLKVINSFLVVALLISAFVVYSLEYSIKRGERDIVLAKKKTRQARETIRLLDAEWSMLTQPERLQRLASKHLKLRPVKAAQIVPVNRLAAKLPERPVHDPSQTKNDPLAKMLEDIN